MIFFEHREGLNSKRKTAAVTQRKLKTETPSNKKSRAISVALLFFILTKRMK